jgi:pilus assembly protein Flp/PilA
MMIEMIRTLCGMLLQNRQGASSAEYALLLSIVGAALAVAAIGLGSSISNSMNTSSSKVANCGGTC